MARMETDAREMAHGLIQGYLGPDHEVISSVIYPARAGAQGSARATIESGRHVF
jgi:hypothetical protein